MVGPGTGIILESGFHKRNWGRITGKVQWNKNGFKGTEFRASRSYLNKIYKKCKVRDTSLSVPQ